MYTRPMSILAIHDEVTTSRSYSSCNWCSGCCCQTYANQTRGSSSGLHQCDSAIVESRNHEARESGISDQTNQTTVEACRKTAATL